MNRIIPKTVVILVLLFTAYLGRGQEIMHVQAIAPVESQPDNLAFAVGVKAGTLGFGGEVVAEVLPYLHLRLGGTYFKYNIDMKPFEEFVKGEGYAKAGGINLLANFQISRVFFLSTGIIYNYSVGHIEGVSAKAVFVGSIEVEPEDVGFVNITVEPKLKATPYLGLGIGRSISLDNKVSFAFELGATYINRPLAKLSTTGMLTPTSSPEQIEQLNENLSWVNLYPILNFQLSYRIF